MCGNFPGSPAAPILQQIRTNFMINHLFSQESQCPCHTPQEIATITDMINQNSTLFLIFGAWTSGTNGAVPGFSGPNRPHDLMRPALALQAGRGVIEDCYRGLSPFNVLHQMPRRGYATEGLSA